MLSSLRSKCLQLAQEAAAAQQPPLQYALRGAAEPAIPRLMQVAICCQQRKLVEASECAGQRAVCGWVMLCWPSSDACPCLLQRAAVLCSSACNQRWWQARPVASDSAGPPCTGRLTHTQNLHC